MEYSVKNKWELMEGEPGRSFDWLRLERAEPSTPVGHRHDHAQKTKLGKVFPHQLGWVLPTLSRFIRCTREPHRDITHPSSLGKQLPAWTGQGAYVGHPDSTCCNRLDSVGGSTNQVARIAANAAPTITVPGLDQLEYLRMIEDRPQPNTIKSPRRTLPPIAIIGPPSKSPTRKNVSDIAFWARTFWRAFMPTRLASSAASLGKEPQRLH